MNYSKNKGLTLVETIIASTLMLIITVFAAGFLFQTFKNFSKMDIEGSSLKHARGLCYGLSVILREVYELQTRAQGKGSGNTLIRFDGELILTPGQNEIIIYPMGTDMFGDKNVMLIDADKKLVIRTYKGPDQARNFAGYPASTELLKERIVERDVNKVKFSRNTADESSGELISIAVEAQSEKKDSPITEIVTKVLLHIH